MTKSQKYESEKMKAMVRFGLIHPTKGWRVPTQCQLHDYNVTMSYLKEEFGVGYE